jgi:hypothetical protein
MSVVEAGSTHGSVQRVRTAVVFPAVAHAPASFAPPSEFGSSFPANDRIWAPGRAQPIKDEEAADMTAPG